MMASDRSKRTGGAAARALFASFALLVMLAAMPARAARSVPLSVGGDLAGLKLGKYLDYYEDRAARADISIITSNEYRDRFRPLPEEDYSFGFTRSAIWLRIAVLNPTPGEVAWILESKYPLIDSICLYAPSGKGYAPVCTGDLKPFSTRPIRYRTFAFPVRSAPGETVYYVRLAGGGAMNMSFAAWTEAPFQEMKEHEAILNWLYYGIMIAMAIFMLFIFLSAREWAFLYLAAFTVSVAFHTMSFNGLGFMYLWPGSPAWADVANLVFNNANLATAILFTRSFLDSRAMTPRIDRFLLACMAVVLLSFMAFPLSGYCNPSHIITMIAGVMVTILFAYGTYMAARGSRPARFYMIAWVALQLGSVIVVLHSMGLVHEGFVSRWGVQIGSLLMSVLLALGIADKINTMRREREQARDSIREADEKYRVLIEMTNTGYVILDDGGKVADANDEYLRLTGHTAMGDILGRSVLEWTSPAYLEKNTEAVESCKRDGSVKNLEIDYAHPDGGMVPVEINAAMIDTREGRRILSICRDITFHRNALESIQASLREKNVLLMEIHHRVKNNLQVISSLISLQAGKIADSDVHLLYEDLNSRIRAMSFIHERLYQSGTFSRIDFAEYIRLITADLKGTYYAHHGDCDIVFDMDTIELDIVRAVPCGLMLNEMLSNTFKYAFPPSRPEKGMIRIAFRENEDGMIELVVQDNGIGLPESVDPSKKQTLGMSLIYLLTEQLRGTVAIDREGGTQYTVRFRKA